MKTITLVRDTYKERPVIFIRCERDRQFETMVKDYPGRIWSQSRRSWYIEDKEDCFRNLIKYFRGKFKIDSTDLHRSYSEQSHIHRTSSEQELNMSKALTKEIPTDRYKQSSKPIKYDGIEIKVDHSAGKLIIHFLGRYNQAWIKELRQYGKPHYNPDTREWFLPASRITIDSLAEYFERQKIPVKLTKQTRPRGTLKLMKERGSEIRTRKASAEAIRAADLLFSYLKEQRYSEHTVKIYTSQLEYFFKYFHKKLPEEINDQDIRDFMENQVIALDYSASYQNQIITAIKTYYSLIPGAAVHTNEIKRPRRSKPLPQVFSKEEVGRILNATRNLKHKLILWIVYSCGLRRGEVINIKLSDLNRERRIVHIRQGKGNVDRVVPVSDKVWNKIDEYTAAYYPDLYLFEGQNGGKYTASSVYNVFKKALQRAGIQKEVGIHSLRHSYATHLHESGLDIRYIQELLGHQSSKTTEIYTHVSRRHLIDIKSPIDDLDLT